MVLFLSKLDTKGSGSDSKPLFCALPPEESYMEGETAGMPSGVPGPDPLCSCAQVSMDVW